MKVASGFGAGMGRMGSTCGAVSGALMAIGLERGYLSGEEKDAKENVYSLVRDFTAEFSARHGSILCRELLGTDISTADGFRQVTDAGLFRTLCPQFVESAVAMLENLLGEDRP